MKQYPIATSLLLLLLASCHSNEVMDENKDFAAGPINYRHEMRQFVVHLSQYARQFDGDFIVIPQNGQELAFSNGEPGDPLVIDYVASINGQGREELFYGFDNADDEPTPQEEQQRWLPYLETLKNAGIQILVTDYCSTPEKVIDSYHLNESKNFISFAADTRDLYSIPGFPVPINNESDADINTLAQAQNFLYLINPQEYSDKSALLADIAATNYDVILMDAFFDEKLFSPEEINSLKQKANGGERLVIAYMSIGEAEDYRFYWQPYWSFNSPDWMGSLNPDWPGNFAVQYWNPEWQKIIFGNESSYLKKIVNSGFDGVYLDIIDAYEYWEEQ